jgi:hypothetical protein
LHFRRPCLFIAYPEMIQGALSDAMSFYQV